MEITVRLHITRLRRFWRVIAWLLVCFGWLGSLHELQQYYFGYIRGTPWPIVAVCVPIFLLGIYLLDGTDIDIDPHGNRVVKQSFWLNKNFIQRLRLKY